MVIWGANNVKPEMMSHATALLTSLRTIAGAIGSAIFVAVMTIVADHSQQAYGAQASMHGVNIAFLAMAGSSLVLILLAVIGTKSLNVGEKRDK